MAPFWGEARGDSIENMTLATDGGIRVQGGSSETWESPLNARVGGSNTFVAQLDVNDYLQWNTFWGGVRHNTFRLLSPAADGGL